MCWPKWRRYAGIGWRDCRSHDHSRVPSFLIYGCEADAAGRFRLGGVKPGGLGLTTAYPGYRTRYLRDSADGKAFEESLTVVLTKEAPAVSKTLIGIKKTVSGKVVSGEQVHFSCGIPEGEFLLYDAAWKDVGSPVVDSGRFTIKGIPEGCQGGILRTASDSASVVLTGSETRVAFMIRDKQVSLSVEGRRDSGSHRKRSSTAVARNGFIQGKKAYNMLGRRSPSQAAPTSDEANAVRAPRRP